MKSQGGDSPDVGTANAGHSLAVPKGFVPSNGVQPCGWSLGGSLLECFLQVVAIHECTGDPSIGRGGPEWLTLAAIAKVMQAGIPCKG